MKKRMNKWTAGLLFSLSAALLSLSILLLTFAQACRDLSQDQQ